MVESEKRGGEYGGGGKGKTPRKKKEKKNQKRGKGTLDLGRPLLGGEEKPVKKIGPKG